MTIATRNRLMIFGIAASIITLSITAFFLPEAVGSAAAAFAKAEGRAHASAIAPFRFGVSPWAVLFCIPLAVLYAGATLVLVYYSFEKTQAAEILFFSAFALSFIVEAARVTVPLAVGREWPPAFIVGAARTVVFGRFFGILSLLAAGIYASGVEFQKHGRVFLIIAAVALTISTGAPVDGLSFDTAFTPDSGYRTMLEAAEIALAGIAVASFIAASYARGAREFGIGGLGIAAAFIGRELLLKSDSWLLLVPGAAILAGGTWLFATKVHRYYLWL
jgi:hypothetical protein